MTTIVLDPNVIRIQLLCRDTSKLVHKVWDANESNSNFIVKIARDERNVLHSAFVKLLEEKADGNVPGLDVLFLSDLLNYWDEWTDEQPINIDDNAAQYLKTYHVEVVEFHLIAIAMQLSVKALCIPTQNTAATNFDVRQLCSNTDFVQDFRRHLQNGAEPKMSSGFQVWTSDTALVRLEEDYYSDLFEIKTQEWLRLRYRNKYPTSQINYYPPWLKAIEGTGEIDVLARDDNIKPRRVLICQCKLRMPLDKEKPINDEDVDQLVRSYEAVHKREQELAAEEGYSVQVYAMLISNTKKISEYARQKMKQKKMEWWLAILPDRWYQYSDWSFEDCQKMAL